MNVLKKVLPMDSFEIETDRSCESLVALLDSQIEPQKVWRFGSRDHKPFQGSFSVEGFKMTRIIHYRNSFLPIIRGTFSPMPLGTKIRIKMSPHPLVIGFMAFWLWTVGSIALMMVLAALFTDDVPWFMPLVPLGMFVFGWGLVSLGFWLEAHKTKDILFQLLQ